MFTGLSFGVESSRTLFALLRATPASHTVPSPYIASGKSFPQRPPNDPHALVALLSAVLPRPLLQARLHAPPRPRHSTAQHAPAAFPPDRPYSFTVSLLLPVSAPATAPAHVPSPPPPPQPFLPLLSGIRHHRHSPNRNHVLFTTRYEWKASLLPRQRPGRLKQKEGPHR